LKMLSISGKQISTRSFLQPPSLFDTHAYSSHTEEATEGIPMMRLPSIGNTSKHFFLVPSRRPRRARDLNAIGAGYNKHFLT
jgi:hypothetical protein